MNENPTATMALLGAQQRALVGKVAAANTPGNLDGLFAFHITGRDPSVPFGWDVDCAKEEWLAANSDQLLHYPTLAALGYALSLFPTTASADASAAFVTGVESLRTRLPFPSDRISFTYHPIAFLGLALGTLTLTERASSYRGWLSTLAKDGRLAASPPYQALLYSYIRFVLDNDVALIDDLRRYVRADDLALVEWGIRRGAFRLIDPRIELSTLQRRVLEAGSLVDPMELDPSRSAVVWSAIKAALVCSIEELVLSRSHVSIMLSRFEDALRRWRWDTGKVRNPIRWPITSEREVQDIVWLILRPVFADLVDEDTLPKVGHSTYRTDFGIPSLRLLVEVKYARHAGDFKQLEKEIMEDSVAYLLESHDRYDRIIVFIYDHSSSVQEHGVTINALRRVADIEDVVIVSRPSQLPTSYPAPCGAGDREN